MGYISTALPSSVAGFLAGQPAAAWASAGGPEEARGGVWPGGTGPGGFGD